MRWVILSKLVSVVFVLLQLRILGSWLLPSQSASLYASLAYIAGISLAAGAMPNLLCSQIAYLEPVRKRRRLHQAIVLFLGCAALMSFALTLAWQTGFGTQTPAQLALIFLAASASTVPTLLATSRFSSGDLKGGALFSALNVVIPQLTALCGVLMLPTETGWLAGLTLGHVAVSVTAFVLHSRRERVLALPSVGSRAEIQVNKPLFLLTLSALFYAWVLPNFPRIQLAAESNTHQVVQILLLAALSYSASNATETLCVQLRRHHWLKTFEFEIGLAHQRGFVRREVARIVAIFALAASASTLVVTLAFPFVTGTQLTLAAPLVAAVIGVDFLRAASSSVYAMSEAARVQVFVAPALVCAGLFYIGTFRVMDASSFTAIYAAAALIVCTSLAAAMLLLSKGIERLHAQV